MRSLSPVQPWPSAGQRIAAGRSRVRILLSLLLVLLFVPSWSGEPRLPLFGARPQVAVHPVILDPEDPARTRLGSLEFIGGLRFSSRDPAFGGLSAMTIAGQRFTLLSDGGLIFGFDMDRDLRPHRFRFGQLPGGPGTGWAKLERDSESLTIDPAGGSAWVGFERHNQIWRYSADLSRVEAHAAPVEMANWSKASGPEAMVRLRSGRFVVLAESSLPGPDGLPRALMFDRDPTRRGARSFGFAYVPADGYRPVDVTELPDGRLLVLERRFAPRRGFTAKLALVDARTIRPGARVSGRVIATFAAPVVHDNFEGLAVTREGRDTMVWIVSDDNQLWFQQTLLLKFRLVEESEGRRATTTAGRP